MFKKKCKNCDEKFERKFKYCPNCGFPKDGKVKENKKDLGLLGDGNLDILHEIEKELPFLLKFPLKKIIGKLMKNLEKNMKNAKENKSSFGQGTKIVQTPNGIRIQVNMVPDNMDVGKKNTLPMLNR